MVRSFSNRILGGVCGGLASATPLNAWIWRIILVGLTVVTWGAAAIAYLLLWWMLPLDSPIRRTYAGTLRGLFAVLLSISLIVGWFLRERLFPPDVYLPGALLILALVILARQIDAGRQGNIALGLVAVLAPTLFLLGELGILPVGYYDIATRSLPALLIFIGLAIVLRYRMPFGSWIALALTAVLVFGISTIALNSRVDTKRDDRQVTIAEPVSSEITLLQINVETRDTDVQLQVSEIPRTISGAFNGSNNSDPLISYQEDGSIATFTLTEQVLSDFPVLEDIGRSDLRLQIPAGIAVAIAFKGERGTMTFDLAALNLERLNIDEVSQGDVVITLPPYNPLSPSVREDPGTWTISNGNLRVIVPETVGTRFILNRNTNSEPRPGQTHDDLHYRVELAGDDFVLVSRQYDTLPIQVEYRINLPTGNLSVEQPDSGGD
jgi:phage shock protein PspC (stress-responsive transcriptional regulator)